jgi:hypothetical protein
MYCDVTDLHKYVQGGNISVFTVEDARHNKLANLSFVIFWDTRNNEVNLEHERNKNEMEKEN